MIKGATLSNDRKYRFELHRIFDTSKPLVAFVGLNPSTADEDIDDPTITKCINYAKKWGYGGFHFVNLFSFRATDPKEMMNATEPIGIDNDNYLKSVFQKVEKVVCCWGELGTYKDRGNEVLKLINNPYYLKMNKNGQPAHPLYLRGDLLPKPYNTNYDSLNRISTRNESKLKTFVMLDNNVFNYNNDDEITNYLSTHEELEYIYNEIQKVSDLAVVVPIVSIENEKTFELNLNVIVKYENPSELGQWTYYLVPNFINNKTNLFVLLKTLEGATNCNIEELIESIKSQAREIREDLGIERRTFIETDSNLITFGIEQ